MAPPREVIKCNTSDNHDYELLTGLVYSIAASGRMVVEAILRQTPFLIAQSVYARAAYFAYHAIARSRGGLARPG